MNTDFKKQFYLFIGAHRCPISGKILLCFLMALSANGCVSTTSKITLHLDQPPGPPIVGFGAQMNPYMYCPPNMPPATETDITDLEQKIIALHPQHVRIFCLARWFFGFAATTQPTSEPIAVSDAAVRESFLRTVALAQRAGATINLTLWYGPFSLHTTTDPAPPGQLETAANQFSQILHELIVERHFTAIQYITVQNEVNGEGDHGRHFKMIPSEYCRLYRALDADLRFTGLRDKIKIVAGDLVAREQEFWIPYLASRIADIIDGYSMHAYWDYWDTKKPVTRLSSFADLVAALPSKQQKPLYATEFGVRGKDHHGNTNDPGNFAATATTPATPIANTPLQAVQLARFIIESVNRHYVAAIAWNMDDTLYDHPMQYGLIGSAKKAFPEKPAYYVIQLFTQTSQPGWRNIPIEISANQQIAACAFAGAPGEYSIYLLNRSDRRTATINLNGLPPVLFHQLRWNADANAKITAAEDRQPSQQFTAQIPPLSMTVLTTKELQN